jgi:hypothetical protein
MASLLMEIQYFHYFLNDIFEDSGVDPASDRGAVNDFGGAGSWVLDSESSSERRYGEYRITLGGVQSDDV